MPHTATERSHAFVTRLPILDAAGAVQAYELLYGEPSGSPYSHPDQASERGLTDAVITFGLDVVAQGRPAFLTLPRELFVQAAALLPSTRTVLQIRHDQPIDDEIVAACRDLKQAGYGIALDWKTTSQPPSALLPYADYIKLDGSNLEAIERYRSGRSGMAARTIATRVETAAAQAAARAAGATFFQGGYFCKPATCRAGALPARRHAYLQLLAALRKPNVGVRDVEELIRHDVSLTVRLLKCVNSAAAGRRSEVTSIRQALILLGLDPIRKWASIWAVAGLNGGGPTELVAVALLRARCCELLGQRRTGPDSDGGLFLLGLCSLLDAMMDRPLADAIADLPLEEDIRQALLGQHNTARVILEAVMAYEQGDWDDAASRMQALRLPPDAAAAAYGEAMSWVRDFSSAA
jgi:c-di-GMP-related signal transduction protein